MKALKNQEMEICTPDSKAVVEQDQNRYLLEIPTWSVFLEQGTKKLVKEFIFNDFSGALEFTNKIGQLAEVNQHHPEIHVQWGKVTVIWWTHTINGLHKNDFILAAKSEGLYVCNQ